MRYRVSIFWKKVPFLKIVLATLAGILFQWYVRAPTTWWLCCFFFSFALLCLPFFIPLFTRFRFRSWSGLGSSLLFISFGAWLIMKHDIREDRRWYGNFSGQDGWVVTIAEPLSEKPKTWKAVANVNYAFDNNNLNPCKGKIILYLAKQNTLLPKFGDQVYFSRSVTEIENFIPGFHYKRYCHFRGITHQVFLKPGDYQISSSSGNWFRTFIYSTRDQVLSVLRQYIQGKKETGLAEALLIGYKDDLDKGLVQSYTNTGVVHIIAISGLHLGLIYLLLSFITKPLLKKKIKWLRPVLIISCLWLFSLLAGAQPSILRSALMFTCIVIGNSLSRSGSIYNTMAVSAFIIMCINPFSIWDIGFQLSYAAVLSIILFMKPIYNLLYFKNKLLDQFWKLNAVTLSAQVLTIPLCIYHFHQFPNFFLLTNFIAVPLSSLILLGEIVLCVFYFFSPLASFLGKLLTVLIRFMNNYIERVESIPQAVSYGLNISFFQMALLYGFIIASAYWLIEKKPAAFKYSLVAISGFLLLAFQKQLLR